MREWSNGIWVVVYGPPHSQFQKSCFPDEPEQRGEGKTGHGSFSPISNSGWLKESHPTSQLTWTIFLCPQFSPSMSHPGSRDFLSTWLCTAEWKILVLINPLGNSSSLCPAEISTLKGMKPLNSRGISDTLGCQFPRLPSQGLLCCMSWVSVAGREGVVSSKPHISPSLARNCH